MSSKYDLTSPELSFEGIVDHEKNKRGFIVILKALTSLDMDLPKNGCIRSCIFSECSMKSCAYLGTRTTRLPSQTHSAWRFGDVPGTLSSRAKAPDGALGHSPRSLNHCHRARQWEAPRPRIRWHSQYLMCQQSGIRVRHAQEKRAEKLAVLVAAGNRGLLLDRLTLRSLLQRSSSWQHGPGQ